ncbi:MAG: hypothetical protein KA791_04505 [Flavobacteriales bacterium]|nr:hypothetical protein [Flavobacteriales bacterium]
MERTPRLTLVLLASGLSGAFAQVPLTLDTTFRTSIYTADVPGFVPNAQPDAWISDAWPMGNGNLLISGSFSFFDSWDPGPQPILYNYNLAVLNSDGTRDTTFTPGYGSGGRITKWNHRLYIGPKPRRYFLDGTEDGSFQLEGADPDAMLSSYPFDFRFMTDSTIMLAGSHTIQDTINNLFGYYDLAWIDTNGHYLPSKPPHQINWGSGQGNISYIFPLHDGKFILSGAFLAYDDVPVPGRMIKIDASGNLDTTFHPEALWDSTYYWGIARDILEQEDGKIIAAGVFRFDGDPDTFRLIRMLPNGDLDPTFNNHLQSTNYNNGGRSPWKRIMSLDATRLLIGGPFGTIDGEPRGGIALIDTAGNLLDDPLGGPGCQPFVPDPQGSFYQSSSVSGFLPMENGQLYLFGQYRGFIDAACNDPEQRLISRLWGLDVGLDEPVSNNALLRSFPNPFDRAARIEYSMPLGAMNASLMIFDALGREVHLQGLPSATGHIEFHPKALQAGVYVAVLQNDGVPLTSMRICFVP